MNRLTMKTLHETIIYICFEGKRAIVVKLIRRMLLKYVGIESWKIMKIIA